MSEIDWSKLLRLHAGALLSRQSMTEKKLEDKLTAFLGKEGFDLSGESEHADELVRDVVALCIGNGLVDDLAYAGRAIAQRASQGASKRKMQSILREKGVGEREIEVALENADELLAAVMFAKRKKIGPFRASEGRSRLSEMQKMQRQGFPTSVINTVVNMPEADALSLINS